MADNKKISELEPLESLSNDDEFIVVDKSITDGDDASTSGKTSKIRFDKLKNQIGSQGEKGDRGEQGAASTVKGPQGLSITGPKGHPGISITGPKGEPGTASDITEFLKNNNVGIGTDKPSEILHLREDAPELWMESSNASGNTYALKSTSTGHFWLGVPTSETGLKMEDAKMVIDSSDNVGIGTSSPGAKLDIVNTSNTTMKGNGLSVRGGANSAGAGYSFRALDMGGNTDFFVRGDGNVGIGTSGPEYKLDVGGYARTTRMHIDNDYSIQYFRKSNKTELGWLLMRDNESSQLSFPKNSVFRFDHVGKYNGDDSPAISKNRITINTDGNVRITEDLAVDGNLNVAGSVGISDSLAVQGKPVATQDWVSSQISEISVDDSSDSTIFNNGMLTIPNSSSSAEGGQLRITSSNASGNWNIDTVKVSETDDKLRFFSYDKNSKYSIDEFGYAPFEIYTDNAGTKNRVEMTFGPKHTPTGKGYTFPYSYNGTTAGLVIKHHDDQPSVHTDKPPLTEGKGKNTPAVMFDLEITGDGHEAVWPTKPDGTDQDLSLAISWGVTSSIRKYNDGSAHSFTAIGEVHEVGQRGYNELASYCGEATNKGSTHATLSGVEVLCKDGVSEDACWDTKINSVIGRVARYKDGNRQVSSFMASSEGTKRPDTIFVVHPVTNKFKNGLDLTNADMSEKGALIVSSGDEIQTKIGNSTVGMIRATNDVNNPVELFSNGSWSVPGTTTSDTGSIFNNGTLIIPRQHDTNQNTYEGGQLRITSSNESGNWNIDTIPADANNDKMRFFQFDKGGSYKGTPLTITNDGVEITGDLKVNGELMNAVSTNSNSSHPGIVYVDDFGAVGDGVTDDTKAIQDAIDSLVAPSIPPNWPQDEIDYFATLNMELTIAVYTLFRDGDITSATEGVEFWAGSGLLVQALVRSLNAEVAMTGKSFIEPNSLGGTVMLGNGHYLIDPGTTEEHWEPWPEYANYNGKTHPEAGQEIPSNICLRSGQPAEQVTFNTQDCDDNDHGQLNDESHIVFQIFASFYGYTKFSDLATDVFDAWRTRKSGTSRQLIHHLIQKRRNENNSDLFIREGVTLKGVHANPSIAIWHTNSPGCRLIVGGKASIAMEKNSSLDGCYVMRKGIRDKMGNADDFAGYGIRPMGWDVTVSNCFVAGFEYGIYAHFGEFGPGELQRSNSVEGTTGRCNFRKVLMDNINGIIMHSCYDITYIDGCECFPFLTFGSTNRTWPYEQHGQFRNGVAFSLRGHNDWTKMTDCFSFGYMTGFEVDGGHNCSLRGCGADNLSGNHLKNAWIDAGSPNDENGVPLLRHQIPGTKGFKIWDGPTHNDPGPSAWGVTDTHTLAQSIVDCQAAAHEIGYFFHQTQEETTLFDNNGDTLQMTACQSWYCAESVRVVNGRLLVTNHYHNSQWPDTSEGELYEHVPIEPIAFNQIGGQIDVIGCQLQGGLYNQLTENKNNAANIQRGAVTSATPGIVNVDDFGAVGDGVTDDTAAIQAAIDSLPLEMEVIDPKTWGPYQEDIPWFDTITLDLAIKIYTIWRPDYANMTEEQIKAGDGGIAASVGQMVGDKVTAFCAGDENLNNPQDPSSGRKHNFYVEYHAVSGGGKVLLGNKSYAINSPVNVWRHVTLEGPHANCEAIAKSNLNNIPGGSIRVKDNAQINLHRSSTITGCYVVRHGIGVHENNAANFAGIGIATKDGHGVSVTDCFVGGFEYGILVNGGPVDMDPPGMGEGIGRIRLRNLNMDNVNCIYLRESWDICYLHNIHCWPFLTQVPNEPMHTADEDNPGFRKGTAFDFRGQSDWTKATDCFSYGYKTGFNINKGSRVLLKGCGVDNVSSYIWKEHNLDYPAGTHVLPGTIAYNMGDNDDLTSSGGAYVEGYGTFAAPIIVDCQAAAHDIGFNIKLPAGQTAQFSECQTWACQTGIKMRQTPSVTPFDEINTQALLTASNCQFDGTGVENFIGLNSIDGGLINAIGCGFKLMAKGPNNETLATPQIKYKGNVTSSHENDGTFLVRSKETSGTTNTFTCDGVDYPLTTKMSDIAEADREGVANCIYQQVLGRDGDSGGLTWVTTRLDETLDSIIQSFLNGQEQPTTDPRDTAEYVQDTPIKITDDGVEITGELKVNGDSLATTSPYLDVESGHLTDETDILAAAESNTTKLEQAIATALADPSKASIELPPGRIYVNKQFVVNFPAINLNSPNSITIRGCGQGTTSLCWVNNAPSQGIKVNLGPVGSTHHQHVTIRDFDFVQGHQGLTTSDELNQTFGARGTALEINGINAEIPEDGHTGNFNKQVGDRVKENALVENCSFGGWHYGHAGWNKCIVLDDAHNSDINNCTFRSYVGPIGGGTGQGRYWASEVAIHIHGDAKATDIYVHQVKFYGFKYGIKMNGTVEGVQIAQGVWVHSKIGISWDGHTYDGTNSEAGEAEGPRKDPFNWPLLVVTDCHLNCNEYNIEVRAGWQTIIKGCSFYGVDNDASYGSTSVGNMIHRSIYLDQNTTNTIISANTFSDAVNDRTTVDDDGNVVTQTQGDTFGGWGPSIEIDGHLNYISGNTFTYDAGAAAPQLEPYVKFGPAASGNRFTDNMLVASGVGQPPTGIPASNDHQDGWKLADAIIDEAAGKNLDPNVIITETSDSIFENGVFAIPGQPVANEGGQLRIMSSNNTGHWNIDAIRDDASNDKMRFFQYDKNGQFANFIDGVVRPPLTITNEGIEVWGDVKVNGESISSSPESASGIDNLTTDEVDQIKLFLQHWEIDSNGNLLPKNNNSVDVGNAEQKVRDIYEQD